MTWERPSSVPVGHVWRRFQRSNNGKTLKYQVRDVREEDKQKAIDFMEEIFLRDEPLCAVLDIKADAESIDSIKKNWARILDLNLSQACYLEDENGEPSELAGFNFCYVRCSDDPPEDIDQIKGERWKTLNKIFMEAESTCDVFKYYGVDKFLTSTGLTLLPEHRGMRIGEELYKAREPMCKALGLPVMATVMTAISSQTVAERCGYDTISEIQYSKLLEQGIDLSNCSAPSAKLMGIKYKF